jgi:hypothetical protein
MVRVGAAGCKTDGALAESSRLALNANHPTAVIDHEIAAGVLAEWDVEVEAHLS